MHLHNNDTEWRKQLLSQECMPEEGVLDGEKLWESIADQLTTSNNEAFHSSKGWIKYVAAAVLLISILLTSIPIPIPTLRLNILTMASKISISQKLTPIKHSPKLATLEIVHSKNISLSIPEKPLQLINDTSKVIAVVKPPDFMVKTDSLQYAFAHLPLLPEKNHSNSDTNIAATRVKKWKIVHINELRNPPEIQVFAENLSGKSNERQWELPTSTNPKSQLFPKFRKHQPTSEKK